jgi:hypothetical protein
MEIKDKAINNKTVKKSLVFFGTLLYPLLYWLDLTGPDDTPSNGKIMYFMALVVVLASLIIFGYYLLNDGGLTSTFVLYAVLVLSFAGGHDLFKAVLKNKGFFSSIEKISGQEQETKRAIESRREQGKEYGVEPTDDS